jgi:6-phosphogluconolactonase (cycloisomerase 2 family)
MTAALSLTKALAADPLPLRVVADSNPDFSGVWVDTVNNEIAVGDDNKHGIFVYSRTASGPAAPLRVIRGLDTQLDYPSSVVIDVVNGELWAVNNDTSDLAGVFTRTANGNVAPLRIIDFKLFDSIVEKRTYGWAVDAVNNEVAGTFQQGSAVYFFDRIGGDLLRSISGSATGLADPHGVFIDTVNGEILVVNEGHVLGAPPQAPSITVYTRTAMGNVAPLRTVQGALTGLSVPRQIYVDTTNNEIFVTNNNGSVIVFPRLANGNVAPLRTISGALTGLQKPTGVFADAVNNELVVADWGGRTVSVFARAANGNVAPLRTITGGATPVVGFGNTGAMSLDLTNNEFAVTNCVSHPRVAFFSRLANGQVAPVRVLEGKTTRISRSLHAVAIDPVNNEVLVPSRLEDALLVFNRAASGDVAPIRVIQGPLTRINNANGGVAVDTVNNEIALVNANTPSITIYNRLANGNVAPLREITDASLTVTAPQGVWIDTVNNEIVLADTNAVVVFPRLANGPTTPLRIIAGASTMINRGRQVAVDTVNNEIILASQGARAVNPPIFGGLLVFDRLANGDVAPKRFIQHVVNSNVKHPRATYVDPVNNEVATGDSKENEVRIFPRLF